MAEAPDTSIDASSPLSPASSAPSTPPDPTDRLKSPWSQIVRGSPNPPRSKPRDPPSCSLQPDEQLLHQHLSSELRVSDTAAAVVNSSPVSSSSSDSRRGVSDSLTEGHTGSPDQLINDSSLVDSKLFQHSPAKSPKVVWGKLVSNPAQDLEPEPVMGAVAWPALSEACSAKASESSKAGTTQKSGAKSTSSSSNERHHLQAPPLLQREIGETDQSMVYQEPINQVIINGNNLPNSAVKDTPSPRKIMQPADAEQSKWSGGKDSKVAAASEGSSMHSRGTATSNISNKETSRNFTWEQGRGNHSFPAYGRGHASAREHTLPSHQQRGGQRSMPQPYVPFVHPNPGFVYPAGYQNVSGGMYYMPAPTSDPVMGATYFVPPGVPGMFMPPDILTMQGMVVKQIEYYFSVENLCRDIYLRSKMDEWGFVPVSVIANFNRVRAITSNPYFIIEALRLSNVVEVQGDKVRKKGDWANWLLPSGQTSVISPSVDRDQAVRFSTSSKKAEVDHLKSDNLRTAGADNQSNGHSHLASQIRERIEALSATAVTAEGGSQDSLGMAGSYRDEKSEDLQVDDADRHFTQSCGVESGHIVE
ncbi:hypothetical protein L7F22_001467 [Adiantum nelumboides]|nr:hypothetical protein [Adiantum nelumboides]